MPGSVLGVIPARSGSKGLPGKNLRLLSGRSLVALASDAARASGVVDRVVVSTDNQAIADDARRAGAETPFLRPAALAADDSPMVPVIEHALAELASLDWVPEIVVLLQPTSPLRRPEHIREAVDLLRQTGADSVASVVPVPLHLSPDYVMRLEDGHLRPFLDRGAGITRRQDARPAYVRDGTVYAFWRETLQRHGTIYGARCHPLLLSPDESVTIDSAEDWATAERFWRERDA
jgi:CMP-N,N'-diacetyllegionaminic acid synthase